MKDMFVDALRKKYEADISVAKATIEVYMNRAAGIGEHPQFIHEIDKQLEVIGCAQDKCLIKRKIYQKLPLKCII